MFNVRLDNLTVFSMLTTTGVVDTGGKLTTGVVDTGGNFVAGVIDNWDTLWIANISTKFRYYFMALVELSKARGKMIHKKTCSPFKFLKQACNELQ